MGYRGSRRADRGSLRSHSALGGGGLDFDELAWDLAAEMRIIRNLEDRIETLYEKADPAGIVISAPGVATVLAGGILGRLGDAKRFADLAGVRAFSGKIPR